MDLDSGSEGSVTGPPLQHGATMAQDAAGAMQRPHASGRVTAPGRVMGPVAANPGALAGTTGVSSAQRGGVSGLDSVASTLARPSATIASTAQEPIAIAGPSQVPAPVPVPSSAPTQFSQTAALWRTRELSLRRRVGKGAPSPTRTRGVLPAARLRSSFQQLQAQVSSLAQTQTVRQQQIEQQAARTIQNVQGVLTQSRAEREQIAQNVAALQLAQTRQASAVTGLQQGLLDARQQTQATQASVAQDVAALQTFQSQQASAVSGLARDVAETRRDATQRSVSYDLSARTTLETTRQQVEEQMQAQQQSWKVELAQLRSDIAKEVQQLQDDNRAKDEQIKQLQAALIAEQQTVLDLQTYLTPTSTDMVADMEVERIIAPDALDTDVLLEQRRMQVPAPPHVSGQVAGPSVHPPPTVENPVPLPPSIPAQPPSQPPPAPRPPPVPSPTIFRSEPAPVAYQPRPKEPPAFRGELNEDLTAWLSQMRDYCHLIRTSDTQNVSYAVTLLQGHARIWWDSFLRNSGGRRPANLAELERAMRERFLSPMAEDHARIALWSIGQRQGESVHGYAARFQNLLQRLSTYDEVDTRQRFIRTLRPELRMPVAQRYPATLMEAIREAEHLELLAGTLGTSSKGNTQAASTSVQQTGQQRSGGNWGRNRGQGQGQGRQGQQQGRQGQPQGRQGQIQGHQGQNQGQGNRRTGNCYYCGKAGHLARDCRKRLADLQGQSRGGFSGRSGRQPQTGNGSARVNAVAYAGQAVAPVQQPGPDPQDGTPPQGNA